MVDTVYSDEEVLEELNRFREYLLESLGNKFWSGEEEDALEKEMAEIERRLGGLTEAFVRSRRSSKRRKRTEAALRRSERELRLLSSQLLSAHEEERRRIALEVHDGIGQSLSAIKVRVELALREIGLSNYSGCTKSLSSVVTTIQDAIEEVRRISMNLRPLILDELGILATLSWLCREAETLHQGIRIEREITIEEEKIPYALKTVIYRVSQEALNNIARHSRADRVCFSLRHVGGKLELRICDNGLGFDQGNTASGRRVGKGLGLTSMKERTEMSGGTFIVESRKGGGVSIRAIWPL